MNLWGQAALLIIAVAIILTSVIHVASLMAIFAATLAMQRVLPAANGGLKATVSHMTLAAGQLERRVLAMAAHVSGEASVSPIAKEPMRSQRTTQSDVAPGSKHLTFDGFLSLLRQAGQAWIADYASSMGAALAYYTLFSLAPLMILIIAVAGTVFGRQAVSGQIVEQMRGLMGNAGADGLQGLLASASRPTAGLIASIVSVVTMIVGATSVFSELQSSLDRIWRAPTLPTGNLLSLLRGRLLSFGLIVTIGFLLLLSLIVSAGISAFGAWWGGLFPGTAIALEGINLLVSLSITTLLFAAVYRTLPSATVAWNDVWMGSAVTALLFTIGKFLIGLYIGHAGLTSAFGAAGSLVVLLLWVYYSAQIFLLGAEFTWLYAHRHGSQSGKRPDRGVISPFP